MTDKADVDIDVAALDNVEAAVLAGLRVGQRLALSASGDESPSVLCTEDGVRLVPLPPTAAVHVPRPRVIIRAIKRETGTGAIQRLQVRVYRLQGADPAPRSSGQADGGGRTAASNASALSGAPPAAGPSNPSAQDEYEYKLRRAQYQALADSVELRDMLTDPRLQAVLTSIDSAQDRERALAVQMENPEFQGFVSQVLRSLDSERVPATAATVAAAAMAARQ